MVKPFRFSKLPRIIFGSGKTAELPSITSGFGKSAVIVTGEKSLEDNSSWKLTLSSLKKEGVKFTFIRVVSEPSVNLIDESVAAIRTMKPAVIIAAGGGSVMDAGKAISAMSTVEGSVKDYLEGVGRLVHPGTKIPFIAIPTTSGTGSEATKNAVISHTDKNGFKRSLRHENFVPDIALVDPELTLSCTKEITAFSGMDCFTQLLEAYLSTGSNSYTDVLAFDGIRSVKESLASAYLDGSDIRARSGMSYAALTSGICLANAGLGVVHGFASSIGAMYNIPHGIICGTLMGISNEINIRKLMRGEGDTSALRKYALMGELFLGECRKNDDYYISWFIDYLHHLTYELNLPGLKEAGVSESDFEKICSETDCKNNPVKLDKDELMEILNRRFV